ncbi:MAG TPA: protein-disulfide reductase DsbD N-terminal domain-containing protein [Gemmatimonadaceae bacterium]|nr:protein-disulfide reductase DsbD N-terminal domain-containing protein [Gemmatimonadaceae bacterium]
MKTFLTLLLLPILGGSIAPPLKPVRWALVGGGEPRTVTAGKAVNVVIQAEIAKGWYIYSLTQKPGGPFPLRIQLEGGDDVGVRGAVRAPRPVIKFDPSFGIETQLHRGKPMFAVPLGVPAGALSGKRDLVLTARYQACSDTLCLPPRTEKIAVSLRVVASR